MTSLRVQGTQDKVPELEINVDTVYLRSNIERKHNEENDMDYWEYDEIQMTIPEYLKSTVPEDEQALAEITSLFAAYQAQIDSAIAELSTLIGGQNNV